MRRLLLAICILGSLLKFTLTPAFAGTYSLTDGREFSGEPITIKDDGVVIKSAGGTYSPRITWDKFSQEGLKTLLSEARTPNEKGLIEALIEPPQKSKAKGKEVVVKPITPPDRPTTGTGVFALFSSAFGLFVFLVVWGAIIYAGYEVAVYRDQPIGLVCGLAAVPFVGILSPAIFFIMKRGTARSAQVEEAGESPAEGAVETTALAAADSASASSTLGAVPAKNESVQLAPETPPKPAVAPTVTFKRGDFTFNRRFFETKLAGFQKLVPSGADKDMVVWIKAIRGEFTGRRITQINPNDLHLQIFSANATADEVIPFVEILEVQIRHKDAV